MIILTALITSVIGSFLFGRFYLNLQYHKSNAGFRQKQIIDCTTELVNEYMKNEKIDQDLHYKYQYALSEVIEKLIITYGTNPAIKRNLNKNEYPNFLKDGENSEIDFFKENIRPIMIDLNNNAFIGWINWVPNVKRLTTLWDLCFTLEKLTVNIEYLKTKNDSIISFKNGLLIIKDTYEYSSEVETVKNSHEVIRKLWFKWLLVNNINTNNN